MYLRLLSDSGIILPNRVDIGEWTTDGKTKILADPLYFIRSGIVQGAASVSSVGTTIDYWSSIHCKAGGILENRQDVRAHQSQKQELGFLQLQSLSILSICNKTLS